MRPEQGLLQLRKGMGLFTNLRPVSIIPSLIDRAPIKPEFLRGVDIVVVRELTGGILFGMPRRSWRERRGRAALDTLVYREYEIARICRVDSPGGVAEKSRLWTRPTCSTHPGFGARS